VPSGAVGVWLAAQMVVEVLLCSIIIYYVCREKSSTKAAKREQEKTETLIRTLDRLVEESEDLEKKHLDLLQLWEKIEKKGGALETYVDFYKSKCDPSSPANTGKDEKKDGVESGVACYEKTLRLIERGIPVREIAQEVGLPQGEVELIMNLRGH
jgi:DNA-binding SARP family transcriptional activator